MDDCDAAVEAAITARIEAIRAMPDATAAFAAATRLAILIRASSGQTAKLRADMIRRVRAERALNLTELAVESGLSKQALQQLVTRYPGGPDE